MTQQRYSIRTIDAEAFLDNLIEFAKMPNQTVRIEKEELLELLTHLTTLSHPAEYYLERIPSEETLYKKTLIALEKKDFHKALEVATIFKQRGKGYCRSTMEWLLFAIKFKPADSDLSTVIPIDNFFTTLNSFHIIPEIKDSDLTILFEALKQNSTIEKLRIGNYGSGGWRVINSHLTDYLKITTCLKELKFTMFWNNDRDGSKYDQLRYVRIIADGLKENKSLESLDFSNFPFGNEGLNIILKAINENSYVKISFINLQNTRIDNESLNLIEDFLVNHPATKIAVDYNLEPDLRELRNKHLAKRQFIH